MTSHYYYKLYLNENKALRIYVQGRVRQIASVVQVHSGIRDWKAMSKENRC
jgi:hypothetical protein